AVAAVHPRRMDHAVTAHRHPGEELVLAIALGVVVHADGGGPCGAAVGATTEGDVGVTARDALVNEGGVPAPVGPQRVHLARIVGRYADDGLVVVPESAGCAAGVQVLVAAGEGPGGRDYLARDGDAGAEGHAAVGGFGDEVDHRDVTRAIEGAV